MAELGINYLFFWYDRTISVDNFSSLFFPLSFTVYLTFSFLPFMHHLMFLDFFMRLLREESYISVYLATISKV